MRAILRQLPSLASIWPKIFWYSGNAKRSVKLAPSEMPWAVSMYSRILIAACSRASDAIRGSVGETVATVSPTEPRIASDARLHAAMRILEYIETAQGISDGASLTERFAFPEYQKILGQMLAREGSWRSIARIWTRRELAQQIELRWHEAHDAARVIGASLSEEIRAAFLDRQ